jgi:hypothetical protein
MTTLRQDIAEYRMSLDKEAKKYMQYFSVAVFGFSGCLTASMISGSSAGLPWLLGAMLFQFGALWSLVEGRHLKLLSAVQAVPVAVKLLEEDE